jgi:protein O-mannosyl-transferase
MRRLAATPGLLPLGLGILTSLVFSPSLRNDFVWDDIPNLVANPHYRGLGWEHLRWIATSISLGHYIPLTRLSFAVDYVLWGMNPVGYHLSNIVLHSIGVVLFYFVATPLLRKATTLTGRPLVVGATTATLFFAIHPLRVESVAWITERRDVLSGVFLFVTTLLYVRACDVHGARRGWLLAGSVVSYGCALAAKSIVMTFPAVVVLLNIYPLGRLGRRADGWGWNGARAVAMDVTPFLLLSALAMVPTYAAQMAASALGTYPWSTRIVVAIHALWFYLVKTILPVNLSPLYEVPIPLNPLEPRFIASAAGVLAVSALVLALRRQWPGGLALWMYYVIALSPTLGIVVRAGFQFAADRYTYVGCLGWALGVGAAAGVVARAYQHGAIGLGLMRLAAGVAVAGFVGFGVLTWQQVQIWRDGQALWARAVQVNPDCALCHTNLGLVHLAHGAPGLAVEHLERAVQLRPDRLLVRGDLGLALARLGRLPEALAQYEAVLTERPDALEARQGFAQALHQVGRREEAVEQLRVAGLMAADDAGVQVSLGFVLMRLGNPADAVSRFNRAIELEGHTAPAHLGLSQAYLALGRMARAREEYEALRALDPGLAARLSAAFPPDRSP